MFKTEFSSNPNGKLFMSHFNEVRLYNPEKHFVGAEHEIWLRNYMLGTGSIVAIIPFKYSSIRDVLAFTVYGKPAHYLASMLNKFYTDVTSETQFAHIVFHYTKRNVQQQQILIQEWWQEVYEAHKTTDSIQQTLGI